MLENNLNCYNSAAESFDKKIGSLSTITVTYWQQDFVLSELEKLGFKLLKKWNLDYTESDGSITTDVVLVVQK